MSDRGRREGDRRVGDEADLAGGWSIAYRVYNHMESPVETAEAFGLDREVAGRPELGRPDLPRPVNGHSRSPGIIGIIGGLGPLASAEFVKTLYAMNVADVEQQAPQVVLYSDPRLPDRTEALLSGRENQLLDGLLHAMDMLRRVGAQRMVICCMTAHHLLPRLPAEYRQLVVSLVDLVLREIAQRGERHLVLCTDGARRMRVFENDPQWKNSQPWTIFPDEHDQALVHASIYKALKQLRDLDRVAAFYAALAEKYHASHLIAGCTEIHLLAGEWRPADRRGVGLLDPLTLFARNLQTIPA